MFADYPRFHAEHASASAANSRHTPTTGGTCHDDRTRIC